MLHTVRQPQKIIIRRNDLYARAPGDNDSAQVKEIIQLRQRITELEDKLTQVRQDLAQERHYANIDLLTGIPNRRAYQERLRQELLRSNRDGNPFCLIIWDIDHFKSINDRYGHQTGDKVLACVAKKITQRLRKSDFTARFGGEEFVSLLPDCDTADTLRLVEQLRAEISHCDHVTEQGPVQITISCGIAEFDPNESDNTLFARADAALYQAKQQGRNRVCLAQ